MSDVRLYIDEDAMDRRLVDALRGRGVDFCQLHGQFLAEGRDHAGIVVSLQDYAIGEQMRRLLKLMAARSAASMVNQLVFLSTYSGEV
jgi:hypothetical protein